MRFQELGISVVTTRTADVMLAKEECLNTTRILRTEQPVIILANHIDLSDGTIK